VVFARRLPRYEALIRKYEIPLRLRFAFVGGSHVEPIRAPPARSPVPRCEWDRRLAVALDGEGATERALDVRVHALELGCLSAHEEAELRYFLGARAQREGHLERATSEYERVLELEPAHRRARLNRAYARLLTDPGLALMDFVAADGLR
jgi:tetratricopeptide (TPR) repeat protein